MKIIIIFAFVLLVYSVNFASADIFEDQYHQIDIDDYNYEARVQYTKMQKNISDNWDILEELDEAYKKHTGYYMVCNQILNSLDRYRSCMEKWYDAVIDNDAEEIKKWSRNSKEAREFIYGMLNSSIKAYIKYKKS